MDGVLHHKDEVEVVNEATPPVEEIIYASPEGSAEEFPLAQETLIRAFIDQKRPVVLRRYALSWRCCKEWRSKGDIVRRAGEVPVRAFLSRTGNFHLDGSWNPRTVLTCSMACETSITGLFRGMRSDEEDNEEDEDEEDEVEEDDDRDGKAALGRRAKKRRRQQNDDYVSSGEDEGCRGWDHAYALDETFHRGRGDAAGTDGGGGGGGHVGPAGEMHPLARDVPRLPLAGDATGARRLRHVSTQLFLSRGTTQTQLHRDPFDNFYVVAGGGARMWSIAHPAHAPWLVADPTSEDTDHENHEVSAAAQPALGIWGPKPDSAKRVRFSSITLAVGDALFLPSGWWHSVKAFPPYSAAVNWYFEGRPSSLSLTAQHAAQAQAQEGP